MYAEVAKDGQVTKDTMEDEHHGHSKSESGKDGHMTKDTHEDGHHGHLYAVPCDTKAKNDTTAPVVTSEAPVTAPANTTVAVDNAEAPVATPADATLTLASQCNNIGGEGGLQIYTGFQFLNVNIIVAVVLDTVQACCNACVNTTLCATFNFQPLPITNTSICILTSSTIGLTEGESTWQAGSIVALTAAVASA
ncbi:unnamed protein product [Peronospora belbahrii]|nr:unnamed protein product [Peronospora belbahrii]